ncbi:MAG: hypothetical protein HY720_31905 [Planctomycetes bacterium]|nr:hypothetical protein [Planctomycetota bacterium]
MKKTIAEMFEEVWREAGYTVLRPGESTPDDGQGLGKRKAPADTSAARKNLTRAKTASKKPARKQLVKRHR